VPSIDPHEDRPAGSPVMPSFASLRGPSRRSPVDVLLPGEPRVAPPAPRREPVRPPEWADLLHLATHLAGIAVALPAQWARRVFGG
jgi:hypothetical protein